MAKAAIARRLDMSRNTVDRLLALREPPRYAGHRRGPGSTRSRTRIAAMLAEDPTVRATVIREHLRPLGYAGGITILKEHLAKVRPGFLAARTYQRTDVPARARSARSTGGTPERRSRSGTGGRARRSVS